MVNSDGVVTNNMFTNERRIDTVDSDGERMNITGASGAIPRNDLQRMDAHAELYYEEIRKRQSDVVAVANNTTLLNHELTELKLMAKGLSCDDAHTIADETYSFTRFVRELDTKEGVF